MSAAQKLVDTKIAGKKVVMFSKTYCPYCRQAKDLLQKNYKLSSDDYEVIELDEAPHSKDAQAIQNYLRSITGASSVPRVFVNGKSVGGCDDTQAAHRSGQLKKMIEASA